MITRRPVTYEVHAYGDLFLESLIADVKANFYYGAMLGLGRGFVLFQDWDIKPYARSAGEFIKLSILVSVNPSRHKNNRRNEAQQRQFQSFRLRA